MPTTTQDKNVSITQQLIAVRETLPFEMEQAMLYSEYNIANYVNEHAPILVEDMEDEDGTSNTDECEVQSTLATALMAAGRLDWLLRKTRASLSGMFSEADVFALLDCNQGDIFYSSKFDRLASDLCDHLGIDLDDYETSHIALLVNKLRSLSSVQRVTLADALEQTWLHGVNQKSMTPVEAFETLGIDLA